MKILDKYIIKKMLSTYLFTVLMLVTVICVLDYTEKSDAFVKCNLSFEQVFMQYFLNFIPYMANMLSPITIFIATVFVTSKMASHTEIIAMLNGGMSFRRLLWPFVMSSSIIAVVIFVFIGWIIPNANKKRIEFEVKYLKDQFYYNGRNIHFKTAENTYVYLESYNNQMKTGYQFTQEKIVNNLLVEKLKTTRITWDSTANKWLLDNYSVHTFDGIKETVSKGPSLKMDIGLKPSDFESQYMLHETLTFDELDDYITLLKSRGVENIEPYLIERYERYAYPFAIIILTLIGVILSSRKTREGVGLQVALGFLLAFAYIIMVIMSRSFGGKGSLDPMLAAWLPNIVFSTIGLVLYTRVQK